MGRRGGDNGKLVRVFVSVLRNPVISNLPPDDNTGNVPDEETDPIAAFGKALFGHIAAGLADLMARMEIAANLSDRELCRHFYNEVWFKCTPEGTDAELIARELLKRFEAARGIKRDPNTDEMLPEEGKTQTP
jgi:hypothetical protein